MHSWVTQISTMEESGQLSMRPDETREKGDAGRWVEMDIMEGMGWEGRKKDLAAAETRLYRL